MSQWLDLINSKNHDYDNSQSGLFSHKVKEALDEFILNKANYSLLIKGFKEQGVNLGLTDDKTINLDGKLYQFNEKLTKNVTITIGTKPTTPICASSVLYVQPNGHTITFTGVDYWINGKMPELDYLMRYVISTTITGDVIAEGQLFPKPPVRFFDDFTTIPLGGSLNGKTPSGGTGHWLQQGSAQIRVNFTTSSIHKAYSPIHKASPIVIAVDDFADRKKLRIKANLYFSGSGGFYSQEIGFYSKLLTFKRYKESAASNSIDYFFTIDNHNEYTKKKQSTTHGYFEIHAEDISDTKLKAGVKLNTTWIVPPKEYTVPSGFFTKLTKPYLSMRVSNTTPMGTYCSSFLVDEKVDW